MLTSIVAAPCCRCYDLSRPDELQDWLHDVKWTAAEAVLKAAAALRSSSNSSSAASVGMDSKVLQLALEACIRKVVQRHYLVSWPGSADKAASQPGSADRVQSSSQTAASSDDDITATQHPAAPVPESASAAQQGDAPETSRPCTAALSSHLAELCQRWLAAEELSEEQWQQVVGWVEQHGAAAAALMAGGSHQAAPEATPGTATSAAAEAAAGASSFSYLELDLQELNEQQTWEVRPNQPER
jgi:hypothetical protein